MRFLIAAAIILAAPASAQQTEAGWQITFTRDTFTGETFPIASTTDGPAAILAVCEGNGLAPYISTRMTEGDTVDFRAGDQIETFAFHYGQAPQAGNVFRLDGDAALGLLAMFGAADGPVSYRTEAGRQGVLPSIGAAETFAIMRDLCSE